MNNNGRLRSELVPIATKITLLLSSLIAIFHPPARCIELSVIILILMVSFIIQLLADDRRDGLVNISLRDIHNRFRTGKLKSNGLKNSLDMCVSLIAVIAIVFFNSL